MRFLVTADLHMNQTINSVFDAEHGLPATWVEAVARLREIVELANERDVDYLLVGGDLFDDGLPSPEIVGLTKDAFAGLDPNRRVVIVSGNHEHRGISGHHRSPLDVYLADQPWAAGVYSTPKVVDLDGVALAAVPWHRVAGTNSLAADSAVLEQTVRQMYDQIGDTPSLLLGHLTVAEADFRNRAVRSAENMIRDSVLEALVPAQVLEDGPWSAALLGHVHRAQSFGDKTRYLGSTFPIMFGEGTKSVEIIDLDEDGSITTEKVVLDHRLMDVIDLSETPSNKPHVFRTTDGVSEFRRGDMVRLTLDSGQTLTSEEDELFREARARGVRVLTESKPVRDVSAPQARAAVPMADLQTIPPVDTLGKYLDGLEGDDAVGKERKDRIIDAFTDIAATVDSGGSEE